MRKLIFILALLIGLAGCSEWASRPVPGGIPTPLVEPTLLEALVETIAALTVANTASAPVNPYATPISIGLAGIVAMLEALRRKERTARKNAELRLNGNHTTVVRSNNVQDKT